MAVLGVGACGKKKPPVARPMPPPTADRHSAGHTPPAPPTPVPDTTPIPPEPTITDDPLVSGDLDTINKNSPFQPVFFPLDSFEVDGTGAAGAATRTPRILKKYPTWVITIEGHCDERGTAEYNLALGEKRALAAKTYLVSLGVPADRLRTVSYGKEFPFDPGHDEARVVEEPPRALRGHEQVGALDMKTVEDLLLHDRARPSRADRPATPALAAANKEHLQLMAEIRMLQEQNQQLQQLLGALQDTLKTVSHQARRSVGGDAQGDGRPDAGRQQHRRQRARAAREDRRNQRPDLDGGAGDRGAAAGDRLAAARRSRSAPASGRRRSGRGRRAAPPPPPPVPTAAAGTVSPQRMYEASYDDYTAGRYDLAIQGFQGFIQAFPRLAAAPPTRSTTSACRTSTRASGPKRATRSRR